MGEEKNISTEMDELPEEEEKKKKKFKVNKNLIMLKVTLFFLYGATSSLAPYLTIHMQSIGITIEEIALIYMALPFTTFLASPVTGFLVDKFGQYKPVVIVSFILTAVLHHSLLLIPHQETPGVVPPGYVLTHPKKGYIEVWWSPCPSRECPIDEELDVVLDTCEDHCLLDRRKMKALKQGEGVSNGQDPGYADDLFFHLRKRNHSSNSTVQHLSLDMHPNLGDPIEQFGIDLDSTEDEDVIDIRKRFNAKLLKRYGVNVTELDESDLRCGGIVQSPGLKSLILLKNITLDCILQKCEFRLGGPEVCPPDYKESDDKIFWLYFVVRFVATIVMTAGVTIMDPIALTLIEKHGGDFGKEKLFSSLGMALFSPITGFLIDLNSKRLGYTDYSAAFYTYDILMLVSAVSVYLLPIDNKLPADNVFRDLMNIIRIPKVIVFIIFLFVLGNFWGFIESFLFFYLRDLGAPNYLLGITVTVGTISSLPFLYGAEGITKKLGHVNIIIIAFFAHAARLMGYSVIESAWWCFPFEALESLSVHLMWVAAATYCTILAPKSLLATIIGVLGMAHFSIGRGSGSFWGGHLIGKMGCREAFRLMGLLAAGSGVAYAAIHFIWLRNAEREEEFLEQQKELSHQKQPLTKDQSTMVSFERLSLVIEYNQIGSLSSLAKYNRRGSDIRMIRSRSNSIRRESINEMYKVNEKKQKNDLLLKSALEINHSKSTQQLKNISNTVLDNSSENNTANTGKLS